MDKNTYIAQIAQEINRTPVLPARNDANEKGKPAEMFVDIARSYLDIQLHLKTKQKKNELSEKETGLLTFIAQLLDLNSAIKKMSNAALIEPVLSFGEQSALGSAEKIIEQLIEHETPNLLEAPKWLPLRYANQPEEIPLEVDLEAEQQQRDQENLDKSNKIREIRCERLRDIFLERFKDISQAWTADLPNKSV